MCKSKVEIAQLRTINRSNLRVRVLESWSVLAIHDLEWTLGLPIVIA